MCYMWLSTSDYGNLILLYKGTLCEWRTQPQTNHTNLICNNINFHYSLFPYENQAYLDQFLQIYKDNDMSQLCIKVTIFLKKF